MPTKDELEQENAALRARVAELEQGATAAAPVKPARPVDDNGKPILSAGEAQDLAANGVTVSPFDGSTLNALDEGVEPLTPTARRRAELERAKRPSVVEPAGPAPAAD